MITPLEILAHLDDDKPVKLSDWEAVQVLADRGSEDWLLDVLSDKDVAYNIARFFMDNGGEGHVKRMLRGAAEDYLNHIRRTDPGAIDELRAEIRADEAEQARADSMSDEDLQTAQNRAYSGLDPKFNAALKAAWGNL